MDLGCHNGVLNVLNDLNVLNYRPALNFELVRQAQGSLGTLNRRETLNGAQRLNGLNVWNGYFPNSRDLGCQSRMLYCVEVQNVARRANESVN
jgi:hypothetical protein